MTTTKQNIQIDVRQHQLSSEHWIAIVTTRKGLCYSCVWTGDKPSDETVADAWKTDRRAFQPYYS